MPRGIEFGSSFSDFIDVQYCLCRPGADDVLVLRQELIKMQTLMDSLNQDHDKEKEHLANELSEVRRKLQLYVLVFELTLSHLACDLQAACQ